MYLLFLVLQELSYVCVDVSVVVLAVEDRLASSIFASCDVELELPAIEDLVVAVEWTQEHFLHSYSLLDCLVHLGCRVVTAVIVVFASHDM